MKRFFLISGIIISTFINLFLFLVILSFGFVSKSGVAYDCELTKPDLIDRLKQVKEDNPDLCINMRDENGDLIYQDEAYKKYYNSSDFDHMSIYFKVYDGCDSLILYTDINLNGSKTEMQSCIDLFSVNYLGKDSKWIIGPGISWCESSKIERLFETEVLDKLGAKWDKNSFAKYFDDLCLRSGAMLGKLLE